MKSSRWETSRWMAGLTLTLLAPALILLSSASSVGRPAAGQGETIFKAKCASCHGPDGSGQTTMGKMMKLHDLKSAEVQSKSDAQLTDFIVKGKTPMPAYGSQLSKEQIKDVVAYLRELAKK